MFARIKELEIRIRDVGERRSSDGSSTHSPNSMLRGLHQTSGSPESSMNSGSASSKNASANLSPLSLHNDYTFVQLQSPLAAPLDLGSSAGWSDGTYPSADCIEILLNVFIARHIQCGFELHLGRTIANLRSNTSEPVVPALLYAILLMACHFVDDDGLRSTWESVFLTHTRQAIEENIDKAYMCQAGYNALHHLQAMVMLGIYYYIKGRLLEGHVHCSSATRFAVALNIHRLDSRIFRDNHSLRKSRLPFDRVAWQPCDPIELGEAINLWWTCCLFEYAGSTTNGLLPSVHRDDIATVWPCSLDDFDNGRPLSDDNYSVAALLDPQLSYIVADVSQDSSRSLIAKSCILMEYAGKLDMERVANPQCSEEWWTRFENCDRAVIRYTHTMPPVLAVNVQEQTDLVLVHS